MAGKAERRTEQITQLRFDSLGELPADDAGAVQERKPSGSRTGSNNGAVLRSDVRVGGDTEDGVFISLGDSDRAIPAARRRGILDEPEPERKPSRDFRITEA